MGRKRGANSPIKYPKPLMDLLRRNQPFKDKLVLKEVLGSGAVSTVRRAVDRKNNKITFAAKIEQKEKLLRNHGACESFGKEIDALTSLKHANIVSWHGIQENDRDLALITEFAPFGDVACMGPLEPLECSLVATQMMEGLAYMHSQGFIHGDIKGQNMLVVSRIPISIRLTDFGTSVRIDAAEACGVTCCRDGVSELPAGVKGRLGTMQYMAPEVLLTDFCCFASDIWSAAVVCKALPAGVNPFKGITEQEDMERAVSQLLESRGPSVLSSLLSFGAKETVCVKSETELDNAVFRREPAERPCARSILSHPEWLSFGAERQEPEKDEAVIKKVKVRLRPPAIAISLPEEGAFCALTTRTRSGSGTKRPHEFSTGLTPLLGAMPAPSCCSPGRLSKTPKLSPAPAELSPNTNWEL